MLSPPAPTAPYPSPWGGGREEGGEKEGKEGGRRKSHYEKTLDTSLSYLPSAVES